MIFPPVKNFCIYIQEACFFICGENLSMKGLTYLTNSLFDYRSPENNGTRAEFILDAAHHKVRGKFQTVCGWAVYMNTCYCHISSQIICNECCLFIETFRMCSPSFHSQRNLRHSQRFLCLYSMEPQLVYPFPTVKIVMEDICRSISFNFRYF